MTVTERLNRLLEDTRFTRFIMAVIMVNAVTLGLETSDVVMARAGDVIHLIDKICLGIFIVEIAIKLFVRRLKFFLSGWSLFDFVIVGVALVPGAQGFSVLRALRILRVLRVISVAPSLRRVVEGFVTALPGMGSVFLLMAIIFYIGSVMATKLFGDSFPQWFGTLGQSGYSLFQIMTLESWSMGIVRPVMAVFPWAWLFFIPFIVSTTFTVLNLFIGIIVSAMQEEHDAEATAERQALQNEQELILAEIRALRAELRERAETSKT
ncbi:MAG: ion transporter [Nitratireductor sp.]